MASHSATVSRRGRADAATVWGRYARFDAWSGWAPQISRVTADAELLAPGVRGLVVAAHLVRVRFVVLDVEAPRRWRWRVSSGPLTMTLTHLVESDQVRGGTTATVRAVGPRWFVTAYRPLMRVALGRLVRP